MTDDDSTFAHQQELEARQFREECDRFHEEFQQRQKRIQEATFKETIWPYF
jgi:hypothetical protein